MGIAKVQNLEGIERAVFLDASKIFRESINLHA